MLTSTYFAFFNEHLGLNECPPRMNAPSERYSIDNALTRQIHKQNETKRSVEFLQNSMSFFTESHE